MDFHWDGLMLVCGSSSGEIIFIDVGRGILTQHFPNIHKINILTIRFLHRIKEELLVTISCDIGGVGFIVNFEKSFFSYDVKTEPLTKKVG